MRLISMNILLTLGSAFPVLAYAATYTNPWTYAGVTTIPCLLIALVDMALLIGVPIIVLCIIYSGFLFVTAGDNESQVSKARFVFMWTLVGALVLLGAKAIALAVQSTVLSLGAGPTAGPAC